MNVSANSINYIIHQLEDIKVTLEYKLVNIFNFIVSSKIKTIFSGSNKIFILLVHFIHLSFCLFQLFNIMGY